MSTKFKIMMNAAVVSGLSACAMVAWAQPSIILDTSPTDTEIELANGSEVTIDPISGDIFAIPADPSACTGTGSCDDVQVDITSFTASPTTVNQGQSVNFNWNARGGWSCDGSGLDGTTWNGSGKLPVGSQSVSIGQLAVGSYTAVLNCSNGPVSDQLSRQITVQMNGTVDPQCAAQGRVPPLGLTRDTAIKSSGPSNQDQAGNTELWEEFFGDPFPNTATTFWKIGRNQYAALEFTTAGVPAGLIGQIELTNAQGSTRFGPKLVTISECPGDFTTQVGDGCRREVVNGSIRWSTVTSIIGRCTLQPNTTYYLNVMHTESPNSNPIPWQCDPPSQQPCSDLAASNFSN